MIHHAHPAYISWEEFQSNQQQLTLNHGAIMADGRQGSAREGCALLQGLVICGKCGRRMSPRYHGTAGKRTTYQCDQLRQQDGVHGICWSVPGTTIDAAVANYLLEILSESNLDISLAVLNELEQNAQQQEYQWQLRLERANYEAERAERQFNAVEPENRLVARTLEKRWNEKLLQLAELESAYAQAQLVQRLEISDEQRQQILNLARNIPAVWHSPTTTAQERKEMLRLLVKQVALTPVEHPIRQTKLNILWHTGATSELFTNRPSIQQKLGTSVEVIQAIRELANGRTDAQIATELNCQGLLSAKGRAFTASSVSWIRLKYQINKPGSDPGFARSVGIRSDGCYSTSALAQKLGVGIHTIHYWREKGIVEASQETPNGPWWHRVTPEVLKTLCDKIRRVPVKSE